MRFARLGRGKASQLDEVRASDAHLHEMERQYLLLRSSIERNIFARNIPLMAQWLRKNGPWSIPVIATLLVADRIIMVAHGDTEIALNIVSSSSTATVLVGIAVQIFPYATAALFFVAIEALTTRLLAMGRFASITKLGGDTKYGGYKGEPNEHFATRLVQLLVVTAALGVTTAYTVQLGDWTIYGIYVLIAISTALWGTHSKKWQLSVHQFLSTTPDSGEFVPRAIEVTRAGTVYLTYAGSFVVIFFGLLLYSSSVWLPATQFQLNDGQKIVGYRLASTPSSISILEDGTRTVVDLSTATIRSQHSCQLGGDDSTLVEFLHLQRRPNVPSCSMR